MLYTLASYLASEWPICLELKARALNLRTAQLKPKAAIEREREGRGYSERDWYTHTHIQMYVLERSIWLESRDGCVL